MGSPTGESRSYRTNLNREIRHAALRVAQTHSDSAQPPGPPEALR
jgi:hypothetical protein